jgi:hypothetical protein
MWLQTGLGAARCLALLSLSLTCARRATRVLLLLLVVAVVSALSLLPHSALGAVPLAGLVLALLLLLLL